LRILIRFTYTDIILLTACWITLTGKGDLMELGMPDSPKPPVTAPTAKEEPTAAPAPIVAAPPTSASSPAKPSPAQAGVSGKKSAKAPVFFEGDLFNGLRKEGFIELEKNVQITQEDLKITADRAKVFFKPNGPDSEEVERVEAYGHVVVTKKDPDTQELIKAYGNSAIYDTSARLITMKENAKLRRGKDEFHGAYIEYNVDTGHIKAGKVQGTLTPEKSPDTKSNKKQTP
jgi:lipopolysaccharide transport protein LptA